MSYLDIFLIGLLIYGFIRGIWNGFFVELASLVSMLLGIYIAIKFSFLTKAFLESHVSWNPKTIQVTAFALTFILVVLAVSVLAKSFTVIANFASLGIINKLLGGVFGVLRAVLIISITLNLFQKINAHNTFVEKETLDKSKLYNPIQKVSKMIYPSIEEWFTAFKKEEFQLENDKKRK